MESKLSKFKIGEKIFHINTGNFAFEVDGRKKITESIIIDIGRQCTIREGIRYQGYMIRGESCNTPEYLIYKTKEEALNFLKNEAKKIRKKQDITIERLNNEINRLYRRYYKRSKIVESFKRNIEFITGEIEEIKRRLITEKLIKDD